MIDFATLGGLLLIAGAFALWRGSVQWSLIFYFLADLCWLGLSLSAGNVQGAIMIGIGMLLGVLVYIKTHTGVFVKTLHSKGK